MREYLPCPSQFQEELFTQRDKLSEYLAHRWFDLAFAGGDACIRARHYVGIFPFRCGDDDCGQQGKHLLMVLPKGCPSDDARDLLPFLELLSLAAGGEVCESSEGFDGQRGAGTFLMLLANHYSSLLKDLCLRDFRLYFVERNEDLRAHIRGRLHICRHRRNSTYGRAHILPCQWEEFSSDNWDNRILLGAKRRLERSAAALDQKAAAFIRGQFRPTDSYFSEVQEVSLAASHLHKARLWRMSPYYRRAFTWARLILQGFGCPIGGGQAPPLALDANDAFERFAEAVVIKAAAYVRRDSLTAQPQDAQRFLFGPQVQDRIPDVLIRSNHSTVAVGEAKYKEVLEGTPVEQLGDLEGAIIPRISSADWNQLYVHMRLTGAPRGFFLVPFWRQDGSALVQVPAAKIAGRESGREFRFAVGPLDGNRKIDVSIFGLNLLKPRDVLAQTALQPLTSWLES